jgi:predicted RND superfamily exporter protein
LALNLVFEGDVDGDRESLVELVREIVSAYPGTVLSGVPVVRADAGALTRSEIVKFVPITVMAISVFLILVFREVRSLLAPLIVGAIGVVVCLGIMSAMGVSLSFSTSVLPSVILALACAYTMHFLNASRGADCHDEMADRLAPVAKPVILSGTTTALGFLAMSTTEISLISDLATFGALGVIVVTFAAVTAGPSVLSIFPLRPKGSVEFLAYLSQVLAPEVVEFSSRRRREIISVWLLIILAIALGLPKLHVASDVITWFPRDGQLRTSYEEIRQRLSGITPVNILVEVPEGRVVTTPELIHAIGRFSSALEAHPSVGKSLSVAEPISLVHRELAGWNVSELPTTQELINQYLLLLDGVEQMDDVVTKDRTSANILLRLNENSSSEISAVAEWAQEWWEENGSRDASISVTGIMYEFGRAQDAIALGGLVGLVIALITIGGLIALFFRDVFLSTAALLANVIPVGAILGAVGWLGIPLDAATVCVASLSLGIAVDDTIHVISEFRSNTLVGREPIDALRSTFCVVFPALVITTGSVLIGFGVLVGSEISLVRNLGLMMSVAVVLCLIADSTLLVAVLSLKRRQSTRN